VHNVEYSSNVPSAVLPAFTPGDPPSLLQAFDRSSIGFVPDTTSAGALPFPITVSPKTPGQKPSLVGTLVQLIPAKAPQRLFAWGGLSPTTAPS